MPSPLFVHLGRIEQTTKAGRRVFPPYASQSLVCNSPFPCPLGVKGILISFLSQYGDSQAGHSFEALRFFWFYISLSSGLHSRLPSLVSSDFLPHGLTSPGLVRLREPCSGERRRAVTDRLDPGFSPFPLFLSVFFSACPRRPPGRLCVTVRGSISTDVPCLPPTYGAEDRRLAPAVRRVMLPPLVLPPSLI